MECVCVVCVCVCAHSVGVSLLAGWRFYWCWFWREGMTKAVTGCQKVLLLSSITYFPCIALEMSLSKIQHSALQYCNKVTAI